MKTFTYMIAATLFTLSCHVNASVVLGISDWDSLVENLGKFEKNERQVVHLSSEKIYMVDRPLPPVDFDLHLEGHGARFVASDGYNGGIISITAGGSLTATDLYISGFTREYLHEPANYTALVENHGNLQLSRVTIANNLFCDSCKKSISIIENNGVATLVNTTIFNNESWGYTIRNCGEMTVLNSTIVANESVFPTGITGVPSSAPSGLVDCVSEGFYWVGNTLLSNVGRNCAISDLIDLGGNVDTDDSCGFDTSKNTVNQALIIGGFGNFGGLVPTLGLEPGSIAIDAGRNDICSATDARFANRPVSGSIHSEPKCDAGAFEYGGAFGNADLSVNGMNGLWFSQASDGHYVHVWRVSPDRVYINWTAFDQSADQMWIYAVADTVGENKFSATAYINEGGQLVPGAAPEGSITNEWGSVEIELTSCTVGTLRYAANDGSIGSGEFQIDRLAFVEGGGCRN